MTTAPTNQTMLFMTRSLRRLWPDNRTRGGARLYGSVQRRQTTMGVVAPSTDRMAPEI